MTGPATGLPDGSAEAPTQTTGTNAYVERMKAYVPLALLVALGLALRYIIAAQLLPTGAGFGVDLISFRAWAGNLAAEGLPGFYGRISFIDYTPGYLYVLWLVGAIGRLMGGIGDLVKAPAIIADLALAWLVWSMTLELGASRRRALLAAGIVLFNPITWFDSAIWGQVDSVGVVFLLISLRELWRDRPERAALFGTIAAIIKPQLGIIVPLAAAIIIRRALAPPDDAEIGVDGRPAARREPLRFLADLARPLQIVTAGVTGVLTAALLSAPFSLSIIDLFGKIGGAASGYPYLTVNAFNQWALIVQNDNGLARSGVWICDGSWPSVRGAPAPCGGEGFFFGPVPALVVGAILLVAVIGLVSAAVARRPDRLTMLVGLAALALAFFVVPTRVHERYLFPLYALGAILAAVSFRWRVAYVVLSAATFANLYAVLTRPFYDNPGIVDWLGIGEALRSESVVAIIAAVHLGGFVWVLTQLRDSASRQLERELAEDPEPEPAWPAPLDEAPPGDPPPGRRRARSGRPGGGGAGRLDR